ncbi:MAG: hypothetical protein Fur0023_13890 [Bacteroidia bacterium]
MKKQNIVFNVLSLFSSVLIAQNNALVLNGGYMIMNGGTAATPAYIVINQNDVNGIIRPGGGHIHSENQYQYVEWVTGTNTGSYVIPFGVGGTAADYIPLGFNKINASNITLTVSTYSTNAANNPMPGASTSNGSGVAAVSSIPQSANAIDRYWDIKTNAAVNANLTFSYRGIENTITGPGYCTTDTLKAQNWNGTNWNPLVGPGNPGVTTGIGVVGPVPFTTYAQFVLASVPITPSIMATQNVLCNGGSTGSATVSAYGGLGPYSYTWNPSGGNSSIASGLSAGTYTVTVQGANGCSKTATVNITQPPAISLTTTQSTITCTMSTASATITANGGTPGYSYSWSPSGGTNSVAIGLNAGTYTATVTDANNCQQTQVITITSNTTTPNVTATSNPTITCASSSVNISGSSSPSSGVTVNWLGGVCGPTNNFTTQACAPGNYTLQVTDNSNGCTGSAVVTVYADSNVPNVTANGGTITCSNPTTQIVATTTSSPVNYNWSGPGIVSGGATGTVTVNQGGTYTLVVTNTSNGCSSTITASVPTDTNSPTVSLSSNSATLSCSSSTIQINATATPSGTYSWATSGGTIIGPSNTATLTAGSAGVYSLTVTGSNGCSAVSTATVYGNSNAPQVTLSSNSATITCSNPSVTISATVPGTVTSASYSWSPASGISNGANSSTATFTAGGSYNLTVTDNSNGCSSTTVVTITSNQNPPSVSLSASNPSISCTNGTVDISVTPVNPSDTYLWSGSGTFTGQGTPTISTTTSGTYQVVVTNTINGCSTTQNINIGFDNNLVLSVNGNTLVCQGSNIIINASGATNYTWTDGTNTYTTSNINVPANANITFTLVGSTGACNSTTIIGVSVSPSINVATTASPSNSISIGESVQLNATGGTNYTWTPVTGLDNPTSPNPNASPVQTTTYCVTGYNSNGVCSDTACRVIYVDTRCPELFVPNVFSPNNDGVNDQLKVYGTKCVKEFLMVIYDRWGEKVFETTDVNATWDGTYKGKDMSGATFVYYIKGLYKDDKPIDLKGNFTIVK